MEHIGKIIQDNFPQHTQSRKNFKFTYPSDDPDYIEPTEEEKRHDWLLHYAGVTDLNNTFDNIRVLPGFEETLAAFKAMVAGTATWHMLMVYGGTGNGKSLCCEAIVLALYDNGIRARREKWSDIIRFTLKAAFKPRRPDLATYEEQFAQLRSRKYLIIDDVGMGSTGGNWEWGELEDLVDYRLENELFTVITTNLDVKEMPPRIVSRFRDAKRCRLIHNKGSDYRPLLEKKSKEE